MELFLNLCWLALLVPAYLLWRRRIAPGSSTIWTRTSLIIVCTLGCALVLLFPVISASDDLHTANQAIEESERSFRHGAHCACSPHVLSHASQPALLVSAKSSPYLVQLEKVHTSTPLSFGAQFTPARSGRAPPQPAFFV